MNDFTHRLITAIQYDWVDKFEAAEIIRLIAEDNQEGIVSILSVNFQRTLKTEIDHLISLLPIRQV